MKIELVRDWVHLSEIDAKGRVVVSRAMTLQQYAMHARASEFVDAVGVSNHATIVAAIKASAREAGDV